MLNKQTLTVMFVLRINSVCKYIINCCTLRASVCVSVRMSYTYEWPNVRYTMLCILVAAL